MATTLLRTGLRFMISNGVLEKRAIPVLCNGVFQGEQNIEQPQQKLQCHEIARRMYSKRSVHYTGILTSVNEREESDSDSDNEDERGQSHFWRRKMRTLHSHLDVNKDGVISYEDFMLLAERFSDLGHLSTEAKTEFKEALNELWKEQWGEISPYNLICVEKYLEEMHHVLNDTSLKKKCHHFLPYLFKAVDKDQSGEISVEEFKLFFQCLDLTHDHAVVSFSHIDTNDDGKISLNEFVSLGRDFFLTEDPTKPSKHFWGPLVD
ncbi:PREDICTED: sarcoplasmic calcium-binding protein [Dufourea novaeangliae]|uniref:Sarcoplasmic calcium-binding protein n=1 Tax=Dufourea novaeangliae TaxID=178035 RepID=A0A154PCN0_DUFNO|nr:PREDICTED: sarcoplasmic calcium-binding protein [Dufourea novaeangliae]KZC09655.1 Sarcoplasmic calcium-binding protein [Dufourea novaeangliae]